MKTEYTWSTSDFRMFKTYQQARYHEIVLKLRRIIKDSAIIIKKGD